MHGNIKEATRSVFALCPYFRNPNEGKLEARYLVIIPKVVASSFQRFLEISSPLISNIMAVGTISDNVSSKRKALDEVSLSSSKSEGGRHEAHGSVFQGRKTRGVATHVYLRKMLEKPKVGLRILRIKRFRSC